jgi:hypothetical protein
VTVDPAGVETRSRLYLASRFSFVYDFIFLHDAHVCAGQYHDRERESGLLLGLSCCVAGLICSSVVLRSRSPVLLERSRALICEMLLRELGQTRAKDDLLRAGSPTALCEHGERYPCIGSCFLAFRIHEWSCDVILILAGGVSRADRMCGSVALFAGSLQHVAIDEGPLFRCRGPCEALI